MMEVSAFLNAAKVGHSDEVATLLAHSPTLIDAIDNYGYTALHFATREGHTKVVTQLLAKRPKSINARNILDNTALDIAVQHNHEDMAIEMIDAGLTARLTVVHEAAERGSLRLVQRLLDQNPHLGDVIDACENIPLHYAARFGHEDVVAHLLAHNPKSAAAVDQNGETPLHAAAYNGHVEVVKQLLAQEPDVIDAVDSAGQTPLFLAAYGICEQVVEMLLAIRPEQVFHRDRGGTTLLHCILGGSQGKFFSEPLIEKVWRMNEAALRAVAHAFSPTPFDVALQHNNKWAIEFFARKLPLDEVVGSFALSNTPLNLLRPHVVESCEPLSVSLPRDVVEVVYGYLGFEPIKRLHTSIETET